MHILVLVCKKKKKKKMWNDERRRAEIHGYARRTTSDKKKMVGSKWDQGRNEKERVYIFLGCDGYSLDAEEESFLAQSSLT
jgi:hypothetical protein